MVTRAAGTAHPAGRPGSWGGGGFMGRTDLVALCLSYLRRKIDTGRTPLIHTVPPNGYRLG